MNFPSPTAPAFTLPAAWYHDPGIYDRERHAVFAREWLWVGHAADLARPGDTLAAEVAGWRVFVVRDRAGQLKGFHNVCRHRAAPLVEEGTGHCDVLRCRYHGWVYDTDGRLRATPDFGAPPGFERSRYGLYPVQVGTWRNLVFVNLDAGAPPLESMLGDLAGETAPYPVESFTRMGEATFEMACNWKTYTDNFVEGYHIPGIHAGLNAAIDFERFTAAGRNRIVRMEAPQRDGSIYGGIWLWCYPNMTLSVFPDGMNTSRIVPLSETRTRLVYNFFFRDCSPERVPEIERTIETNCGIVREDFGICEAAQRNLESGAYDRGPLSPRQEQGVHYFHTLLRQSLGQNEPS